MTKRECRDDKTHAAGRGRLSPCEFLFPDKSCLEAAGRHHGNPIKILYSTAQSSPDSLLSSAFSYLWLFVTQALLSPNSFHKPPLSLLRVKTFLLILSIQHPSHFSSSFPSFLKFSILPSLPPLPLTLYAGTDYSTAQLVCKEVKQSCNFLLVFPSLSRIMINGVLPITRIF